MPNSGKPSLGEISTIRDILMGEQMDQYNTRFQELSAKLDAAEERINQQFETIEAQHKADLQELRQQMEGKLNVLSTQLQDKSEALQLEINSVSEHERKRLGQMLSELSQQISNI